MDCLLRLLKNISGCGLKKRLPEGLSFPCRSGEAGAGKGLMHGGAVTALADTAVAIAIKSILRKNPLCDRGNVPEVSCSGAQRHGPRGCIDRRRDERTIKGVAGFDENGVKTATFQSVFKVKRQS
jgi:hypothetical protein